MMPIFFKITFRTFHPKLELPPRARLAGLELALELIRW